MVVLRFEFHQNRLSGFGAVWVEICPSSLTWPLAYTAACTTVQAVIRVCWYVCFVYVVIATKPVHGAPIANPPNNAQSGGNPYHSPKLHPGRCSSVGMPRGTDRQTGTQTAVITIHFASYMTHAICNYNAKSGSMDRRSARQMDRKDAVPMNQRSVEQGRMVTRLRTVQVD